MAAATAAILAEFDHESRVTRSLLERVPESRADWKPHPRSTALGALASHIANLTGYGEKVLTLSELDFAPPGGVPLKVAPYQGAAELLERFDANVVRTREAMGTTTDDDLRKTFTLKYAGNTIFSLPRKAALRTFMMNHMIHHRGQLSVYLRLNEVPLPSIYGPTADS